MFWLKIRTLWNCIILFITCSFQWFREFRFILLFFRLCHSKSDGLWSMILWMKTKILGSWTFFIHHLRVFKIDENTNLSSTPVITSPNRENFRQKILDDWKHDCIKDSTEIITPSVWCTFNTFPNDVGTHSKINIFFIY